MVFQGPGGGISGTSNQFAVGYAQSAGNAQSAGYATYASAAGNATYASYASNAGSGTVRAWYSRTNGNGSGVNGMQFGNNNAYAFYVNSLGTYYLVLPGGGANGYWNSAYQTQHDTFSGSGGYTNGVIVIG